MNNKHEKLFDLISSEGNANQSHNKALPTLDSSDKVQQIELSKSVSEAKAIQLFQKSY